MSLSIRPGIRKTGKIGDSIEKYSILRAEMAVDRSDVCLILIDATEGVTAQDERVAGIAHESGKACIIVINKWDLIEKDTKTMDEFRKDVYTALSYMTYAPIVFISAKTGQRVNRLFELINYVNNQAACVFRPVCSTTFSAMPPRAFNRRPTRASA